MNQKTVRDIDVTGKRVLVRVDFNVPIDPKTGAIADDTRIRAILPTLSYLLEKRARLILCSHLGRPRGKEQGLSLAPVAQRLSQLLNLPVRIAEDCNGQRVDGAAQSLAEGQVLLLENLRFHLEEEKNDPVFAQALAKLADIFVNDAFGVCHRSHASTVGVTKYLPSVAGFLLEKELDTLTRALDNPTRPFTALIGGKKVRDKMGVIENILDKVDSLLIAGGMVSTFLKLLKYNLDQTIVEEEAIGLAQKLVDKAGRKGVHLLLPIDVVVADRLDAEGKSKTVSIANIPSGWHIMDIGPRTIEVFVSKLRKSKTVIWNGPVGIFEFPKFQKGSRAIATTLASLDATTIVGGGSTAEVVQEMGLVHKLTHVSTGGGASLKLLEGQGLPGVASLMAKD